MFQVELTNYGQTLISSQVIIDGIILLYDFIEEISSLSDISSYTVNLDEEACGNINKSIGNVRIRDLSALEYQSKTILFYVNINNEKKIIAGYSQNSAIIQKNGQPLTLFLSLDFSVFTNGFLFSSIQAGMPNASYNSDGIVHIENPDISSDDTYSVYSKQQVDELLKNKDTELIRGTQSVSTASWTGNTVRDSLYEGMCINYFLPFAGKSSSTLTLTLSNGSTTDAVPIYFRGATAVGTHFPVGSIIQLTYMENVVIGSTTIAKGWFADSDYVDGNTTTYISTAQPLKAGTNGIYGRCLVMRTGADTWESIMLSYSNKVASHVLNTSGFYPDVIYYTGATSKINAGDVTTATHYNIYNTLSYTNYFADVTTTPLVVGKPFYFVGTFHNDGKFYFNNPNYHAQEVTTGDIYVLVGIAYSTTTISLLPDHPMYTLKDGVVTQITHQSFMNSARIDDLEDSIPTNTSDLTNDSGFITSSDIPTNVSSFTNDAGYLTSYTETDPTVPSWAKQPNKPSYTAAEVHALPDTTVIPTVNDTTITIKKNNSDTGDSFTTNTDTEKTINLGLATVATSGSYNDLLNKPTIPTVNDTTITIKKNTSDTGDSFTTNTDTEKTINLGLHSVATSGSYNDLSNKPTIPTNTSDLTNDAGFITSSDIPEDVSAFNNDAGYLTSYTETDPTVPSWAKQQNKPSYTLDEVSDGSTRKLSNYVPTTRKVNNKALSADITLNLDDVADGTNRKLENYIPYSEIISTINGFDNRRLWLYEVHNTLWAADKRYDVTRTGFSSGSNVSLFNGSFEDQNKVAAGGTGVILIAGKNGTKMFGGGYPYGYLEIGFYYTSVPESVTCRVYSDWAQNPGWHDVTLTNVDKNNNNALYRGQNSSFYGVTQIEITVNAKSDKEASVTEIAFYQTRGTLQQMATFNKSVAQTLYFDLEAPKFKTTGGTASQFVKGDGTLDNSAYITSASLPTKVSDLTNDAGYITSASIPTTVSSFTNDAGYITSSALSPYALTANLKEGAFVDVDELTMTSTSDNLPTSKAVASYISSQSFATISQIPTNVSQLNNDAGYLTQHQSLAGVVATAQYNSTTKKIEFYNSSNTKLNTDIDASDFIKDGMVDTVSVTGGNLVITFNTDAGKEDITIPITDIFDASNYYTKTEIDNAGFVVTSDLDDYVEKVSSTDNAITRFDGANGAVQNSGVLIDDSNNLLLPLGSSSTFSQNAKLVIGNAWFGSNTTGGLAYGVKSGSTYTGYYTFESTAFRPVSSSDNAIDIGTSSYRWKDLYIAGKICKNGTYKITIPSATGTMALVSDIPTKTSDLTNDSGFITISSVPTKTSDLTNDSGFITSASLPTKTSDLTNDSGFITSASLPTKVSDLTNDSGFITSADIPTGVAYFNNDAGYLTSSDLSPYALTASLSEGAFVDVDETTTTASSTNLVTGKSMAAYVSSQLPTVNNATLTIQKNGSTVNTFTANAATPVTANITVPTTVAELDDSDNYVTQDALDEAIDDAINSKQNIIVAGENVTVTSQSQQLPDSYAQVEYIQSNGQSYINTNIAPTDTMKMIVDAYSNSNGSFYLAGSRTNSSSTILFGQSGSSTGATLIGSVNGTGTTVSTDGTNWSRSTSGQRYLISLETNNGTYYYNIIDKTNNREFTASKSYTLLGSQTTPIWLCAFNTTNILTGTTRIYRFELYDNEIPVFIGVPCYRLSDGKYGLYDTVSNSFFPSNSSTGFTGSTVITDTTIISAKDEKAQWGKITGTLSNQTDLNNALSLKANSADLADVAISGDYNDLTNQPTIPDSTSDLTNDSGFITSEDIPTNISAFTNDSGYLLSTTAESTYVKKVRSTAKAITRFKDDEGSILDSLDILENDGTIILPKGGIADHAESCAHIEIGNGWIGAESSRETSVVMGSIFNKNPIPTYYFTDSLIRPSSDNSKILGSQAYRWKYLYLSDSIRKSSSYTLSIPDKTGTIAVVSDIPTNVSELTNDSGFITSADVPTNVSDLTNDAGYITSSDLPTNHVTTDTVQTITALKTFTHGIDLGTYHTSASQSLSTQLTVWDDTTNYQGGIEVTGNFNPATEDEYNLGSSNFPWLNVYANSFVKSGGTSAQFLKADGSVDSNTYLTSSDLPTNHVTTDTAQEITGAKTIDEDNLKIGNTTTNEDIIDYVFKRGQEFIVGTQSSSTSLWKGVTKQASIYEGMCVNYFVPVASTSTAITLELTLPDGTTTGAIPVRRNAGNTATNTHIGVGSVVQLTLLLNRTVGSTNYEKVWRMNEWYDSNTNTTGYQLRTNSTVMTVTDTARYYKLYFTSADGEHWVPASINSTNNATTARPVNQRPINPFGRIVYTSASTNYTAGSNLAATTIWEQYAISLGYSFNVDGGELDLTTKTPVYLKCAPQSDGSAIMDSSDPTVQELPTTADGKIYIFLGVAYDATHIELVINHPVFYHDGSGIKLWTGSIIPSKTTDLVNDAGFITSAAIPTNVSELNNDAGYITSYTETDPTVPSWAKQTNKPSYTLDEVTDGTTRKLSNYELKSNLKEGAYVNVDETTMTSSSTNLPTGKAVASYISSLNYITSSDLPTNHVTTDTTQTISATKTISTSSNYATELNGTHVKVYMPTPYQASNTGTKISNKSINVGSDYAKIENDVGRSVGGLSSFLTLSVYNHSGNDFSYIDLTKSYIRYYVCSSSDNQVEKFYCDSSSFVHNTDVRPYTNSTSSSTGFDLGTNDYKWKYLYISSGIKNGTYTYSLPSANGTLALTSQIPSVPLESISVDGTAQTITNKNVDLHIPDDIYSSDFICSMTRTNVSGSGNLTLSGISGPFPVSGTPMPAGTYIVRTRMQSTTASYSLTVNFGGSYTLTTTNGVIDDTRTITLSSASTYSASITQVNANTFIKVSMYEPDVVVETVGAAAVTNDYNDLDNIPTIGNGTLTIQKNGSNVATFTANNVANVTANITVPTTVASLSDASNYVTTNTEQSISALKKFNNGIDLMNEQLLCFFTTNVTNRTNVCWVGVTERDTYINQNSTYVQDMTIRLPYEDELYSDNGSKLNIKHGNTTTYKLSSSNLLLNNNQNISWNDGHYIASETDSYNDTNLVIRADKFVNIAGYGADDIGIYVGGGESIIPSLSIGEKGNKITTISGDNSVYTAYLESSSLETNNVYCEIKSSRCLEVISGNIQPNLNTLSTLRSVEQTDHHYPRYYFMDSIEYEDTNSNVIYKNEISQVEISPIRIASTNFAICKTANSTSGNNSSTWLDYSLYYTVYQESNKLNIKKVEESNGATSVEAPIISLNDSSLKLFENLIGDHKVEVYTSATGYTDTNILISGTNTDGSRGLIRPMTAFGVDIGTSIYKFNKIYANTFEGNATTATTATEADYLKHYITSSTYCTISYNADSDIWITTKGIEPNSSASYYLGTSSKCWLRVCSNIYQFGSSADCFLQSAVSNSINYINAKGHIAPYASTSYDLGFSDKKWRYIYCTYLGSSDSKVTTVYATGIGAAASKVSNVYATNVGTSSYPTDSIYVKSLVIPYGYCQTAANTANKEVTLSPDVTTLTSGMIILVGFRYGNTVASPKLTIDGGTTYKNIYRNANVSAGSDDSLSWCDYEYVFLRYNGSQWVIISHNPTALASVGTSITNILPSSTNTYNLGSSSYKWNYLYARYVGSSSYPITSIYGRLNSLYGTAVGSLFFFKLVIKNNSSNDITVPRGTSLTSTTYFRSTLLEITSYEERVDDTSSSYGTATFTGTFYTMLRFKVTANNSGTNVYVPCLRYS